MKNYGTREMVLAALGIALVYITTMFIKLPNSIGGYLNLGDGFILLFAGFLHPFTAFLVGGSGSALADLTGGYGTYAIATLIIKGIEGGLIALLVRRNARLRFPAYIIMRYASAYRMFFLFCLSRLFAAMAAVAKLHQPRVAVLLRCFLQLLRMRLCLFHQLDLRIQRRPAIVDDLITSGSVHISRLDVIAPHQLHVMQDARLLLRVIDRTADLHPLFRVAGHHVCAGDV